MSLIDFSHSRFHLSLTDCEGQFIQCHAENKAQGHI